VDAPQVLTPGTTATVTTTFTNTGDYPANHVQITLTAPQGWTITPATPAPVGNVAPGSHASATWQLSAPDNATSGTITLTARATYQGVNGGGTATGTATVSVPYSSLSAAYDNIGITDDNNPGAGAFASSGKTYSAQALAAAGITAGSAVTYGGTSFTWPSASPGTPDNVEANGQVVALSGSGSTLAFLGASTNGTQGGTGTVYYSDGTSQQFTASFSDWWAPTSKDQVVAAMSYGNQPSGQYQHTASLYYTSVPIESGKTVIAVALPTTGTSPGPGMHVFAMAVT